MFSSFGSIAVFHARIKVLKRAGNRLKHLLFPFTRVIGHLVITGVIKAWMIAWARIFHKTPRLYTMITYESNKYNIKIAVVYYFMFSYDRNMKSEKHPLCKYLYDHDISLAKFCRQNKLCYFSVMSYIKEKRYPSWQALFRIAQATNWEVSEIDLAIWTMKAYSISRRDSDFE